MTKLKIIEIVISAAATLLTAAKSVLRFIGYIGKLRRKPDDEMGYAGAT